MLGQKRNDSLFGPGSRTIEAPQSDRKSVV